MVCTGISVANFSRFAIQWDCLSALALWRCNGIAVANLALWRFNGIASALGRWHICCRESVANPSRPLLVFAIQWDSLSAGLLASLLSRICRESYRESIANTSRLYRETVANPSRLLLVFAISRREDWAVALLVYIRYIACHDLRPRQAPLFWRRPSFQTGR